MVLASLVSFTLDPGSSICSGGNSRCQPRAYRHEGVSFMWHLYYSLSGTTDQQLARARHERSAAGLLRRLSPPAPSHDCWRWLASATDRTIAGRGFAATQDSNTQRGSSALHALRPSGYLLHAYLRKQPHATIHLLLDSLLSEVCLPPGMAAHSAYKNRASGGTYRPPAVRGQERRRNA